MMPSRLHSVTRFNTLPIFSSLLLDLVFSRCLFDEKLQRRPLSTDRDVVSVHGYHDLFALDASSPHAWAGDPSRQLEVAESRCELLLPILCGVARAVQALLQLPAHVLIACLVVLWRQFDENSSSCWSVEVRPSHIDKCHNLSSTFTRGNLRQHHFQRLQWRL